MSTDLTTEFLEGVTASAEGIGRDACRYYATSDAGDAWHAGHAWHSGRHSPRVLQVTKGRGYRVNVWTERRLIVALVDWNHPSLTDHAPVSFADAGPNNSNKADRARQLAELTAAAPLQSKGKPVKDAGELPLFIAANEPRLF